MPVVAAACVIFYARVWGVSWHGLSVATVAVSAWVLAVLAQWPALRAGRERTVALAAVGLAVAVVFYWAGWRLSRGLVMTAVPVVALAVFQCLLGLGRHHPLPLRAAVAGGTAAAILVVFTVPLPWPSALRAGLAVVVMAGAVSVWREAGRLRVSGGSQRLARSVIFAAAVWLPLVWWRPGALLLEFGRWENAAFLVLVLLVAWARPEAGAVGLDAWRRRWVSLAALALAVAAAVGFFMAASREMAAPRGVFLGVGAGALVLSGWVAWPRRSGSAVAAGLAWWPEVALIVMALTAWLR